jgi:hypothetical protein
MTSLEERRDAQVELEHEYYEDSGIADEHAKAALAFHGRLLNALAAGASRQADVLSGMVQPSPALVAAGRPKGHQQPTVSGKSTSGNLVALAVLSQSPFRNPNDAEVLQFCTGVKVEACGAPAVEPEAASGVRVSLAFASNPFFSNTTISRVFGLGASPSDDIDVVSADSGTEIQWATGKDATVRMVKKSARVAGARHAPVMSLFRLFTKEGLAPFGEMQQALLNTVKPLLKVSAFAVHAATGMRKLEDQGAGEEEPEE